jgi:predicted Fe-S protein YdhL (DUF1289 family)
MEGCGRSAEEIVRIEENDNNQQDFRFIWASLNAEDGSVYEDACGLALA